MKARLFRANRKERFMVEQQKSALTILRRKQVEARTGLARSTI